jgi:hypothetical protein
MMHWLEEPFLFLQHFWNACQTPYHLGMAVLLVFFILLLWVKICRRTRVLLINDAANGRIEVAQSALEELVLRGCEESAARPKVTFKIRSNQVHTFLRLKLKSNLPVGPTASHLQEKISQILKNHLSENAIGNVHVTITGFTGQSPKSSPSPLMGALDGMGQNQDHQDNRNS